MSSSNGGNRLDRIERLIEQSERANKEAHARIESDLRKWVKMGLKEALSQRKRTRILDDKMTRLASAQLVTEEKLQRFISSMQRGRNGRS